MKRTVVEIPPKTIKEKREEENRKVNVCAYCRVSTDSEDQTRSYDSQVQYYKNYISQKPEWNLVEIYADKGLSGKNVKQRPAFLKMIKDCEVGKIDIVLTKSISRFARNTLEAVQYIRKLRDLGIAIMFEEEKMNTLDPHSNFTISVLSQLAEEESRSISQKVKTGLKHKALLGKFRYIPAYGYKLDEEGKLIVDKEQAKIIKRIFNEFEKLDYTPHLIATRLTADNVPTAKQKQSLWHDSVVRKLLSHEIYIGDYIVQKTYAQDFLSRRVKNEGHTTKWFIKNNHEAIISRKQFFATQEKQNNPAMRRFKLVFNFTFSGLIECGICGYRFSHDYRLDANNNKIDIWKCQGKKHYKVCFCSTYKENDILDAYLSINPSYSKRNVRKHIKTVIAYNDYFIIKLNNGEQYTFKFVIE